MKVEEPWTVGGEAWLDFFHKARFQLHSPNTANLAVNIVIAVHKADVFYLGPDFDHGR